MPRVQTRKASRAGYRPEKVTIRDLFAGDDTLEPSEKALRARAGRRESILVFVESVGNTHYYDRMLSLIRVNAARRCIGPGVQWGDIASCLRKTSLPSKKLVSLLNEGHSLGQVTELLVKDLSSLLDEQ